MMKREGLGESRGQMDYSPHVAFRSSVQKSLSIYQQGKSEVVKTVSTQVSASQLLRLCLY